MSLNYCQQHWAANEGDGWEFEKLVEELENTVEGFENMVEELEKLAEQCKNMVEEFENMVEELEKLAEKAVEEMIEALVDTRHQPDNRGIPIFHTHLVQLSPNVHVAHVNLATIVARRGFGMVDFLAPLSNTPDPKPPPVDDVLQRYLNVAVKFDTRYCLARRSWVLVIGKFLGTKEVWNRNRKMKRKRKR